MDSLSLLLSSRVRAAILRSLFGQDNAQIHLRELARRCDCSLSAVQRELKRLAGIGLVNQYKDGNRSYVQSNAEHPFYNELASLVRKSSGVPQILREALGEKAIQIAFIFGSFAAETENCDSDIDLMLLGSIKLREAVSRLSDVTETIGREINPHVFSICEWVQRRKNCDHFVTTIARQSKLFLIGDEDELEQLAE